MQLGNATIKAAYMKNLRTFVLVIVALGTSNCFFFRKKDAGDKANTTADAVIGVPLGQKAEGPDYGALEDIYAISTDYAPAAIRPDPDTFVRQMLLQYRAEGSEVAHVIGRVEEFRVLLGGASEDFSKTAQETYDSTSLLATLAVADEICEALVAPNAQDHPGWSTILPATAGKVRTNVTFLAQRFLGIHSDDIDDTVIDSLVSILETGTGGGADSFDDYVPVCTTLALDADALLL